MAKIVLGPNVLDMRGKIGALVYSLWKAGVNYCRQAPNVVYNPGSSDQAVMRCNLAAMAKYWYESLSATQRQEWNDWALTEPGKGNKDGGVLTIIKGNSGKMSGYNAFVMANQWLKSVLRPVTLNAPLGHVPPTPPLSVAGSYAGGTVTITWIAPVQNKANAMVRIWMMCHEGLGHRQQVTYENVGDLTKAITSFKGANGDPILFANAPGHYAFQMDTVDLDGTKSGPSNVAEVTVTP